MRLPAAALEVYKTLKGVRGRTTSSTTRRTLMESLGRRGRTRKDRLEEEGQRGNRNQSCRLLRLDPFPTCEVGRRSHGLWVPGSCRGALVGPS